MIRNPTSGLSICRRHPVLTFLGLLAVLGLTTAGIFLATFDLNAYRESLAHRLSKALNQPVSIGSANMSWHRGPVFNISNIRIGDPRLEAQGEIAHLFLHPRLLPLLMGKVVFNDMVLEQPRYRLQVSPPAPDGKTAIPPAPLAALLQTVQVRKLNIVDGQLLLEDTRHPSEPLQIIAIDLHIRNLLTGRPAKLKLHAKLQQKNGVAILSAQGRTAIDPKLGNWHQAEHNLQLHLEDIATEQLLSWFSLPEGFPSLSGLANLDLTTRGSFAKGLYFDADLSGAKLTLAWPGHFESPPALNNVALKGTWTASAHLNKLENLDLRLDDLILNGHLSLQRSHQQPWLEGTLSSRPLALSDIRRFLPDHIRLSEQSLLQRSLEHGIVQIHHLRFAGPLRSFGQAGARLPITDASITLNDAQLQWPPLPPLKELDCSLTLAEGKLHLSQGTAVLLETPLRFNGTAEHLLDDDMSLSFSANWEAPAGKLWATMSASDAGTGKIGGIIPISVSLNGRPGKLRGNLRADLAGCAIDIPHALSKPTGSPAELRFSGYQQQQKLMIDEGALNLEPFKLTFSGHLDLTGKHPLDMHMILEETDLAEAGYLVPLIASQRTSGTFSLTGQLSGSLVRPDFSGQAHLAGAGLSLEGIEAPIRNATGSIAIHNTDCTFSGLQARLGDSPVTLAGKLTAEPEPTFSLRVKAPSIRAAELIFPGSAVVFHNLDGKAVFDRKGIRYEQIRFDLESSYNLSLEGIQTHSDPGIVELDIHGEKVSIDEILALWETDPKPDTEEYKQDIRSIIHAEVDKGHYGPLSFSDARGTITAQNDTVNITPLTFHAGAGFCEAKMLIDNSPEDQSLLTISADMNALEVEHLQEEWLQEKSLITGKLSGHFKLKGPAGRELLPRGQGQATIRIEDGVLRKFSFLSKVFSLLNVSQIFTFNLPDMASHGMPFSSLDATLQLADGQLSTEDLTVTSNAMNLSLVGKADLQQNQLDLLMGVKPFGTVDKIVSKIPLAGWILTGKNKALITAHFRISGSMEEPEVEAIPVTSVSKKVLGIFQRVLGLPGKVVTDVGKLFQTENGEQEETGQPKREAGDQSIPEGRQPQ
jgi:uncharacterized protein YhdP